MGLVECSLYTGRAVRGKADPLTFIEGGRDAFWYMEEKARRKLEKEKKSKTAEKKEKPEEDKKD
jgi:hypothetical protein